MLLLILLCSGCQSEKPQGDASRERYAPAQREIPNDDPGSIKVREEAKDQNLYYDPLTMKKLVKLANEGDEWAIREITWPEGHPLHKKGRPFFKNTKPHPQGLIKHSGYEPSRETKANEISRGPQ
jgi:hypothetical protein